MQIKLICKPIRDKVNELLLKRVKKDQPLYDAAHYCLKNGGKRVRPLLLILACHDLGGDMENAYEPALALEMIHNYSLVHDDLPCMDNDDLRRGLPTVHRKFDEATAVLCGDLLFTEAFTMLAESQTLKPDQKLKLITLLAHYAGGKELLLGQALDLKMVHQVGSLENLQQIYLKKTSSLFCCALEFAAVLSHANPRVYSLLKQVGEKIGLVFQIQNDFLGSKKDTEQNKFTILSLLSMQQAQLLKDKVHREALELLDQCDIPFLRLKDFFEEIVSHEI